MSYTGRKRPWLLRFPKRLTEVVTWGLYPAPGSTPGRFNRLVQLNLHTDEKAPRSMHARLTPRDARTLGFALISGAEEVERANYENNNGDDHYTHLWPAGSGSTPAAPRRAARVPRLGAYGEYADSDQSKKVQVDELSGTAVVLREVGTAALIILPLTDEHMNSLSFKDEDWEDAQ